MRRRILALFVLFLLPVASVAAAPRASSSTGSPPPVSLVGKTVLLAARTQTSGCERGDTPDRACSPGAYYSKLTKAVICAEGFRTSRIRYVPTSEKYAVEREYGMPAKSYGQTLEIDHIVSLELGGSNDIANLFPEPHSGIWNYHAKDRLENRLHDLVCEGAITLTAARTKIASNWKALYLKLYGAPPAPSG